MKEVVSFCMCFESKAKRISWWVRAMLGGKEQLTTPGPSVHTAGRLELLLAEVGKGGKGSRAGEGQSLGT